MVRESTVNLVKMEDRDNYSYNSFIRRDSLNRSVFDNNSPNVSLNGSRRSSLNPSHISNNETDVISTISSIPSIYYRFDNIPKREHT